MMKKVGIITGGSRGFGAALALRLINMNQGWQIAVLDIEAGDTSNSAISYFKCDVSNHTELEECFQKVVERNGSQLDLVVNNAGIGEDPRPLDQRNTKEWEKLIQIHFHAVVSGTRLALLYGSPGCVVINTSSLSGLIPFGGAPVYSASKAAICVFSQAMGPSMRLRGKRIVAVCPAFSPTAMIEDIKETDLVTSNIIPVSMVVTAFVRALLDQTLNGHVLMVTARHGIKVMTKPSLFNL